MDRTAEGPVAWIRGRIGRLRPGRVPRPYLAWVVACWTLTAVFVVLILIPGVTDGIVARQTGSSGFIGVFDAPLGIRVLVAVAGGVLAGAFLIRLLLRERNSPDTRNRVAREVGLAAAAGFPALALAADRQWVSAAGAAALLGLAEIAAHRPSTATRGGTVLAAVLAGSPWAVLTVAQFGPSAGAGSWTWIALFGFAAAFAAFGSYYGIARAAESRAAPLRPLFRDDLPLVAVVSLVGIAVLLAVLRLTVARELFDAPDPELWAPFAETPLSWVHAAAVAALVVVVGARSVARPLRRSQARRVTAGLAVAGNADLALAVGIIAVALVVAATTGDTFLPDIPGAVVAALKLAGVLVVTAVALLPGFRGTTARALAFVTGAFLVPLTLHNLLVATGTLPPALRGYPATPVQIALLLLAVAVVALAVPALRRAWGAGLVVRLAIVPLVAVHAGWLLPAAWSGIGRIVLVVGVVLALLVFLPAPERDPDRHALGVLTTSAGQVLALAVFFLALPSFVDGSSLVVLGLFWLGVAVIAGLVVRTQPGSDDADASGGSSDRDQPVGTSSASPSVESSPIRW